MKTLTCAIQIGTSQFQAVAAYRDSATGTLENIVIENVSARDCMRYGIITNPEKAAIHIKSLLLKLGNRTRTTLSAAYVGTGGMSLHSLIQQPSVQLPGYDVLDAEPISGGQYQLIVGEKRIRQGITQAMERAGIRMIELLALPKVTSAILTPEERNRGCVLVDMGASTTTVMIFKGGEAQLTAVIPLGGDAVDRDIQAFGAAAEEAERIKIEWSDAAHEGSAPQGSMQQPVQSTQFADKALPMPQGKLNSIVMCRYEEIAANILHQIENSGLKGNLDAGCILTGGAAMQRGLISLLRSRLDMQRIEIRAYAERAFLGSERKPHLTSLLGMLRFCHEDCQMQVKPVATQLEIEMPDDPEPEVTTDPVATQAAPDPQPQHKPTEPAEPFIQPPQKHGLSSFLRDLFSGQND